MTTPPDVQLLHVDGDRVRVYSLEAAAAALGMKPRTLTRQAREGQLRTVRSFAPKTDANPFQHWLFHSDDVDECARQRMSPGSMVPLGSETRALTLVDPGELERENAALKARVETLELEEAIRYKDRVTELQRENAELRAQVALLAGEAQRAMNVAANVIGGLIPKPVAQAS